MPRDLVGRTAKLLVCKACAHRCKIAPGRAGICGVRFSIDGKLHLMVYGRPTSVNVDPIEKKPLFHFLPGSKSLSLGTYGCNMKCVFCQNYELSQAPKGLGEKEVSDLISANARSLSPEQVVELASYYDSASIAYTYNEPTIFSEYARDCGVLARKRGIKNVYVTNGYLSKESLEYGRGWLDAMNIDLKSFSDTFYRRYCGATLDPVLKTIKRAYEAKIWIEITTLIIPGLNDSSPELKKIAEFIASISNAIPWHISRFYPAYKLTDRGPTPPEKLMEAHKIGKNAGLKYVYVGNIIDTERESTFCPSCGEPVIERTGYNTRSHIKGGKCPHCGKEIEGMWK